MTTWTNLRMWWHRRRMHRECAEQQLILWHGGIAPLGACTTCYPRMVWIREQRTAKARVLP